MSTWCTNIANSLEHIDHPFAPWRGTNLREFFISIVIKPGRSILQCHQQHLLQCFHVIKDFTHTQFAAWYSWVQATTNIWELYNDKAGSWSTGITMYRSNNKGLSTLCSNINHIPATTKTTSSLKYLHGRKFREWCMTMCKLQSSNSEWPYIRSAEGIWILLEFKSIEKSRLWKNEFKGRKKL